MVAPLALDHDSPLAIAQPRRAFSRAASDRECPDEMQISLFASATLSGASRHNIERHLDRCSSCRQLVAELVRGGERPSAPTLPRAFGGRYQIGNLIGRGGMGAIYDALDLHLHRRVAVKVLRLVGSAAVDRELAANRMVREARAMAALSHPNVVAVFDVGAYDNQVFIAMELVVGTTLRVWQLSAPRKVRDTLHYLCEAGAGLAAAHSAGIVHRDFKPDNVLVSSNGEVRVTDFGLARREHLAAGTPAPDQAFRYGDIQIADNLIDTHTGVIIGTPAYMSPEQLRGVGCDARADQFSFCVTAWEAIYGTRPFAGRSCEELCAAALAGRIEPPPARPDVPRTVQAALRRGLSAHPEDRFSSMHELLAVLKAAQVPDHSRRWLKVGGPFAIAAGLALVIGLTATGDASSSPSQVTPRAAPQPSNIEAKAVTSAQPPTLVAESTPDPRPEAQPAPPVAKRAAQAKRERSTVVRTSVIAEPVVPAAPALEPSSVEPSPSASAIAELKTGRSDLERRWQRKELERSDLPGAFWAAREALDGAIIEGDVDAGRAALAQAEAAIDRMRIDRSFIDQKLSRLNGRIGQLGPQQAARVKPMLADLIKLTSRDPLAANRAINDIAAELGVD
jgi:serine/threonine protein kinase